MRATGGASSRAKTTSRASSKDTSVRGEKRMDVKAAWPPRRAAARAISPGSVSAPPAASMWSRAWRASTARRSAYTPLSIAEMVRGFRSVSNHREPMAKGAGGAGSVASQPKGLQAPASRAGAAKDQMGVGLSRARPATSSDLRRASCTATYPPRELPQRMAGPPPRRCSRKVSSWSVQRSASYLRPASWVSSRGQLSPWPSQSMAYVGRVSPRASSWAPHWKVPTPKPGRQTRGEGRAPERPSARGAGWAWV
mmetsp:Transcript_24856/g.83332  ORF Transcript_24856/g.83332 Transcript_24856/m.83332 type:complete len:253 (+) Transcript_24856:44-802(+)